MVFKFLVREREREKGMGGGHLGGNSRLLMRKRSA